ncbi:hypothetical protein [Parabacteroides provencensis]|uniref:hypothetical protein n=1 Tax=Parabacteroides provencensis TaxID=1944636 RepID=UPI00118025EE|nr:hypothetical protein [Parabacteroides provencensis]
MLTEQMILDGLQYYRWQTEYPLYTTTDSMNDFLENHLPDDYEVIECDGNQILVDIKGDKYEIAAYGDGDFCSHVVSVYQAK